MTESTLLPSAEGPGASPVHPPATHAPHHMRYGDISIGTFRPVEADFKADHGLGNDERVRRKMHRDLSMELLDAEARRIHAKRNYLIRKPRALQYFRGKTLVRSDEERTSGRLELFFDLTFVGIIAVLAEEAVHEATGSALVRYLLTYSAAFLIWTWMREVFNAFYKDDLTQRLIVLVVMCALVVFGNSATKVEQPRSESGARAATIGAYLVAEAVIFLQFLGYSFHIKAYRAQLRAHFAAWIVTSGIWIAVIFIDEVRVAIALATLALVAEYSAWTFVYTPKFKKLMKLRFSSALNIEHEIERFQDYFTLVVGEAVYSIFASSPAGSGVHVSAARAIMAVVIAFAFQLLYMQGASSRSWSHPIRYSIPAAMTWFTLHIPTVSALTLWGDTMAELVREEHIRSGVRWMCCACYAVAMLCIWGLAMIEKDMDAKGVLWFPKWARLTPRFLSGIIVVFLPLAPQAEGAEGAAESAAAHYAKALVNIIKRAASEGSAAASSATPGATSSSSHLSSLRDLNTTKLLGIMVALSGFTLLWEMITSLDGPNAPHETAEDTLIAQANDGHTPTVALSTPRWKGYPTFCEPGTFRFDKSHQRERNGDGEAEAENDRAGTMEEEEDVDEKPNVSKA